MAKFRSRDEESTEYTYFKDGEYYHEDGRYLGPFLESDRWNEDEIFWQNAQRFLFSNKFGQEVYVGSTLEGTVLGSKVKVVVEEDNFGIAHARCIDCKSTDHSKSFNLSDVDILWCYNLKVVED